MKEFIHPKKRNHLKYKKKMVLKVQLDSMQHMLIQVVQINNQGVQAVAPVQSHMFYALISTHVPSPASPSITTCSQNLAMMDCCAICGGFYASQSCYLLDSNTQVS